MIKFPALVMARDLLQHGDEEAGRAARRVIVTLAAIEQAHVVYQEMLPPSVREEVFRGVPLDVLAALLDEPGRSARLVFMLYTLKSILAVWKGEDARYALSLKDFAATVRALWLEALEGCWETVTDEDRLNAWRLCYLLAHADLGGDPELARHRPITGKPSTAVKQAFGWT